MSNEPLEPTQKDAIILTMVEEIISLLGECHESSLQKACFLYEEFFGGILQFNFVYKGGVTHSYDLDDKITHMRCNDTLDLALNSKRTYPVLIHGINSNLLKLMCNKTIPKNKNRIKYATRQVARMKYGIPNIIYPLFVMAVHSEYKDCSDDEFALYMCESLKRLSNIEMYYIDALIALHLAKQLKYDAKLIDIDRSNMEETIEENYSHNP